MDVCGVALDHVLVPAGAVTAHIEKLRICEYLLYLTFTCHILSFHVYLCIYSLRQYVNVSTIDTFVIVLKQV